MPSAARWPRADAEAIADDRAGWGAVAVAAAMPIATVAALLAP